MLDQYLNRTLEAVVNTSLPGDSLYRAVVDKAEKEGWLSSLLLAARNLRPANGALLEASASMKSGDLVFSAPDVRKLGRGSEDLLNRLGTLAPKVCRVQVDDRIYGTGFLVAPHFILTSYYVLESFLNGESKTARLTFGYAKSGQDDVIYEGDDYYVAEPGGDETRFWDEKLGYVLARVDGYPGDDPIGGQRLRNLDSDAPRRGFLQLLNPDHDHGNVGERIGMLHHPENEPLNLTLGQLTVLDEGSFLFDAPTRPGSAGAPIVDSQMRLIGLHQGRRGGTSVATTLTAIIESMQASNTIDLVGQDLS